MIDRPNAGVGLGVVAWSLASVACVASDGPIVRLRGADFDGGAKDRFGSVQHGVAAVNYVYAASTGRSGAMEARFTIGALPAESMFLHVRGRDDDAKGFCPIEIALNGRTLAQGPSGFPSDAWAWKRYAIPKGVLKVGQNELRVVNRSPAGEVGMPPWFMVAQCGIGEKDAALDAAPSLEQEFRVRLPDQLRPLPEPLPAGQSSPSFKMRGTKGWLWRPDQYFAEIPTLAKVKMNFLMNCYGSMCDIEHHPWGSPECNRWWEPLPPAKRQAYENVVRACQAHGIEFCFSMNPNLGAKRILRDDRAEDVEALWQHYAWMQGLGVRWFSICLDDIHRGIDARAQAAGVNAIFRRLRAKDPRAEMIFCPTFYWGTGTRPGAKAYLARLASDLHEDAYVFWTGPRVVPPTISRAQAETYKRCVKHRLFIWDNYPVNDNHPTMHLGPVTGRDPRLCEVVDGYMGNPLCSQNEINRIPLMTMADYAYNARAYDPARSIGQAIVHLADTAEQRSVLRDLVELYPGMLLFSKGPNWNPVLSRFSQITGQRHSHVLARLFLRHVEDVAGRLDHAFPDRFRAARGTLRSDLAKIDASYRTHYGP